MTERPRILSLCSGYGGLDLAVEAVTGGRTVAVAETHPAAVAVLHKRFPMAVNIGDITTADWEAVRWEFRPQVIAAGFPCQDISAAGKGAGIHGPKSGIWRNVAEAVGVVRPGLVFLENVPRIRTLGLDTVIADLAAVGYGLRYTFVKASDVGACHPRRRWFALARPLAQDSDRTARFQRWSAAPGQTEGGGHGPTLEDEVVFLLPAPTAADGSGGPGVSDKRQGGMNLRTAVTLLPASAARDWKSGASNLMDVNARPLNEVAVNLLPTPLASDSTQGTGHRNAAGTYYLAGQAVRIDERWLGTNGKDYGQAVRRWEQVTGHPAPCPTEQGTKGNRRLAPAFSEWMMGLEPGWVTDIVDSRNDALHVLGNGVVPRQAEEAFRFLMDDENWTDDMSIDAMEPNEADAYDDQQPEPQKVDKPRGKCTGCAFDYQLGTARTGEHKGKLVIRKHNSRTGPGLCSGASEPARVEHTEGCTPEARFGPAVCTGCCDDSEQVPDPCGQPYVPLTEIRLPVTRTDVVGVAPGGIPVVTDPWTAPLKTFDQEDVEDQPTGTVLDRMTPEQRSESLAVQQVAYETQTAALPLPFTAPAPASDIPESTTTVSGQPEPDRDRWGRYLLPVGGSGKQAHTRATTFAKLGANTKAIEAWNERNVIRGLALRPDLLMLANGLEVKRDRNDLNSIAAQAKDAAGSKVAANIGTAYHAFTERLDAGLLALGDIPPQYKTRVLQYLEATTRAGLTTRPEWIERTTAVRADQVGAPLPVAGTLDRIFQLPDGSLVIGDLKTGADLSYGEMEIEVQLALYAHGVNTHGLFDWNTKQWERPLVVDAAGTPSALQVRTDIAIVVHLPADGDGCTLYVADIERGWRDAQRLGPLQSSLREKKRFRTLMASDLTPRTAKELPAQPSPDQADANDAWGWAKHLISTAETQARIAELYQSFLDSGLFHTDQLAVLVGLGKDRLNALARG